jgi:hypothetical protein
LWGSRTIYTVSPVVRKINAIGTARGILNLKAGRANSIIHGVAGTKAAADNIEKKWAVCTGVIHPCKVGANITFDLVIRRNAGLAVFLVPEVTEAIGTDWLVGIRTVDANFIIKEGVVGTGRAK